MLYYNITQPLTFKEESRVLGINRLAGALLGLALAVAWAPSAAAAGRPAPAVAVSVKPLHSLIATVMEGAGAPYLIVGGAASPHAYALKPGGARALSRAELIFWVGPGLEGFLAKPLAALAAGARVVELAALKIIRPPPRGGDLHLWLDPANARAIAAVAVAELSALDPLNAGLYRDNAERLSRDLDTLDVELKLVLGPVAEIPFVVDHDAYGYLVRAYGLNGVGFVTPNPEQSPSARRLGQLRRRIVRLGVRCLFAEPFSSPGRIAAVAGGLELKTGVLDPLGVGLDPGSGLYFRLMRANAAQLADCLGG